MTPSRRPGLLLLGALCACGGDGGADGGGTGGDPWAAARARLASTVAGLGVKDPLVLAALGRVPRHEFVPQEVRAAAYEDKALPIGHKQSTSQPYIVAMMAKLAAIGPGAKVLEIGTGSGYGAAVLAEIAAEVHTVEILEPLADAARETLRRLGYRNVVVHCCDGYAGLPGEAPFDAIVVTVAPPCIPEPLKAQLREGGRLVIPVGTHAQSLRVLVRRGDGFEDRHVAGARFSPMAGEAQARDR
jgi:protein-L-isoaspartate(D-aspartate) O-methyltransferase